MAKIDLNLLTSTNFMLNFFYVVS